MITEKKQCKGCGEIFYRVEGSKKKFHSVLCFHRWRIAHGKIKQGKVLKESSLLQKINTHPKVKEWKKEEIRKVGKCEMCGSANNLIVSLPKSLWYVVRKNRLKNMKEALNCKKLWEKPRIMCRACHCATLKT